MFDKNKKRERRQFKTGGMDKLLRFKGFTVKPMKEGGGMDKLVCPCVTTQTVNY